MSGFELTQFSAGFRMGTAFSELNNGNWSVNVKPLVNLCRAGLVLRIAALALETRGFTLPIALERAYSVAPLVLALPSVYRLLPDYRRNAFLERVVGHIEQIGTRRSGLDRVIGGVALGALLYSGRYERVLGAIAGMGLDSVIQVLAQKSPSWIRDRYKKIDLAIYCLAHLVLYKSGFLSREQALSLWIATAAGRILYHRMRGADFGWSFFLLRHHSYDAWSPQGLGADLTLLIKTIPLFFQAVRAHHRARIPVWYWKGSLAFSLLSGLSYAGPIGSWVARHSRVNWHAVDWLRQTALHAAASSPCSSAYRARAMIHSISTRGDSVNQTDSFGNSALHTACFEANSPEMVRALLELPGINLNLRDDLGCSALDLVIMTRQSEKALLLLRAGASADNRTLECALWYGCPFELIDEILNKMQPKLVDRNKAVARFHAYCRLGLEKEVQYQLDHHIEEVARYASNGAGPLHYAALGGHFRIINLLKQQMGSSPRDRDKFKQTALHWFVKANPQFPEATILEVLDSLGGTLLVNEPGFENRTALYQACELGRIDLVRVLLRRGADPNLKDAQGRTPFYAASKWGRSMIDELIHSELWDGTVPENRCMLLFYYFSSQQSEEQVRWKALVEDLTTNVNVLGVEGKPILQQAVEEKRFSEVRVLLTREDIRLSYRSPSGQNIDVLAACALLLSGTPSEWLNELVYFSPIIRKRLSAEITALGDEELKTLYRYHPIKIAASLFSPLHRQKVLDHLHCLHLPHNQAHLAAGKHSGFAWIVPVLEVSEADLAQFIRKQRSTVAVAILAHMSQEKKDLLANELTQLLEDIRDHYSMDLDEKYRQIEERVTAKIYTREEHLADQGTLIADRRHLQIFKAQWPNQDWEAALEGYVKKFEALQPVFGRAEIRVELDAMEQEMLEQDTAQLFPELSRLYEVGLCEGKDCRVIGIELKLLLQLITLRQVDDDQLPPDWEKTVHAPLQQGMQRLSEIAEHLKHPALRVFAQTMTHDLSEILTQARGKQLLVALLELERKRIVALMTHYFDQPERVKLTKNQSLYDCYSRTTDWKLFWKPLSH